MEEAKKDSRKECIRHTGNLCKPSATAAEHAQGASAEEHRAAASQTPLGKTRSSRISGMKYRAEIDGLRAVAVIPVILFHAGFELFNGGFVGVDVFFVISGYLITTILVNDIESGRFSIVNFYERRARRILPALSFVMLACIPFAWMWMTPGQMKDFSQSLVAVSLFSSNILFWLKSGYFDTASEEKPLLHTWSLAVEEQYYVLFPIFLFLAWRFGKNRVFWMIVLLAALSLALSEWGWRNKTSANFYLAPMRAWELFAGSIAAFAVHRRGVQANNALSLLGLAAIAFAIFAYDETTPFPSVYALIPVGGVVLLVLYGGKETLAAKLLSTRICVGIGLISYSAYLWHQPLFAFARMPTLEHPPLYVMGALSVVSLCLAIVSWKYVEQPFRDRRKITRPQIFRCSAAAITAFSLLGVLGHFSYKQIGPGKFNPTRKISGGEENISLRAQSWAPLRTLSGDKGYGVDHNAFDLSDWLGTDHPKPALQLVGNSHSKDLYNVFTNATSVTENYGVTRYGAEIHDLPKSSRFWTSENYRKADTVVIVSRYTAEDIEILPGVIHRLKADGKKISLVKNVFEFPEYRNGYLSLIDVTRYKYGFANHDAVNRAYYAAYKGGPATGFVGQVNKDLSRIADEHDVSLLDRMDYICSDAAETCHAVDGENNKLFYDYGHHTLIGGKFFGNKVDELNWFTAGQ